MRYSHKYTGIAASGVMSMALLVGMMRQMDPVNLLWTALPATLIAGFLGFQMGKTLERPKGDRNKNKSRSDKDKSQSGSISASSGGTAEYEAITGNESFLSDLGDPASTPDVPATPTPAEKPVGS